MKLLLAISFILSSMTACFSQRVNSSCDPPDSTVEQLYIESAAKMAYEYMLSRDSTFVDSINAPLSMRIAVGRALNAVYNSGLEGAKEVTGRVNFSSDQAGSPTNMFMRMAAKWKR